ncbi:MAG TPA: zinc ribbon domain-containing protein [Myxococcota bacterium]|nr:zinc ribbon domain-containing protein [Myxococcota bacterium]
MPTYEYECSNGHHFEVEQSIKDPALKRCKVCRAKAHRLISASHFILKGSGWYADGYGSGKPKAKGDSGSESKPSGESKPAESKPKAESKPDAKPAKSGGEKSSGSSKSGAGSAASAGS